MAKDLSTLSSIFLKSLANQTEDNSTHPSLHVIPCAIILTFII